MRLQYNRWQNSALLIGRVLLSMVFLVAGMMKISYWEETLAYAQMVGYPIPTLLLALATALEILGGVALLLGLKTRVAAFLLLIYLIPVTFMFHSYWNITMAVEASEIQTQLWMFWKNLAISGGLFALLATGPGQWAID